MKKLKKIIISLVLVFAVSFSFAQMMEPEDPGGDPVGEDPIGGGAPISGGITILLTLGAVYGVEKIYHLVQENTSDED